MSDLNVRVEELSPVVRRLDIQVPAGRVTQVTDQVYARLGRTVKLKGYRQGHVPRRVLEKYFSDRVRTDVAREIVDSTFGEALGETNLKPVAAPTVEPAEVKPGEDFRYTARVEVRPELTDVQYKGLEVSAPEVKVDDAEVGRQLEQLREAMTTLVPVEGRDTCEMGDVANASYEVEFVGTGRKPEKREDGLVRVDAGLFVDGHGEKLAGMKVGETREFSETLPDDAGPELAGKEAKVKVSLSGLKRRELPALDDEFAKDVGGASSLEELRAKVREDLERKVAEQNRTARRDALLKALIEKNPVEVPPALVDDAASRLANEFVTNLARRGLQIDAHSPVIEQFKKDVTPRAVNDVKSFFLLDAVADAEHVEVKAEDLTEHIERYAKEEGVPVEKMRARYANRQALTSLAGTIRTEKALAAIEASAKITVEASPASETSAG